MRRVLVVAAIVVLAGCGAATEPANAPTATPATIATATPVTLAPDQERVLATSLMILHELDGLLPGGVPRGDPAQIIGIVGDAQAALLPIKDYGEASGRCALDLTMLATQAAADTVGATERPGASAASIAATEARYRTWYQEALGAVERAFRGQQAVPLAPPLDPALRAAAPDALGWGFRCIETPT